jgi:signal transduction histidine kinase
MIIAPLPYNEHERLQAIHETHILDSGDEAEFDDITELATTICDVPISLITIIDEHRQWIKARKGLELYETTRAESFCSHAILEPETALIVSNAKEDERFIDNPNTSGNQPIVFYGGVPLVTHDGFALGTLCVIDHKPRQLNDYQLKSLRILAAHVTSLLEFRRKNHALRESWSHYTEAMNHAAPFFLFLGKNDEIRESGMCWKKAIPGFSNGKAFDAYFVWENPSTTVYIKERVTGSEIFYFRNQEGTQRYQCHVVKDLSGLIKLFVMPIFNKEFPVENYHLTPYDFDNHGFFAHFIELQNEITKEPKEPTMDPLHLSEIHEVLKQQQASLQLTNQALEAKVKERTDRIARLALFPLQNPNPVFEIDVENKQVSYCNPAARHHIYKNRQYSYQQILELFLLNHEDLIQKKVPNGEFFFEGEYFERNVYYIPGQSNIRLYLHNITKIRIKEHTERLKSQRLVRRQKSLLSMRNIDTSLSLDQKIDTVLQLTADEMNCTSCKYWDYQGVNRDLRVVRQIKQPNLLQNSAIQVLQRQRLSTFFERLEKDLILTVSNKRPELFAETFQVHYLRPSGIQTILFAPIMQNQTPGGFISIEYAHDLESFDTEDFSFAGSVADAITLIVDAEQLKNSQAELHKKNAELQSSLNKLVAMQEELIRQERMSTLGMLIAGIAHELNTPLGAISASTDNIAYTLKHELASRGMNIHPTNIRLGFQLFLHSPGIKNTYTTREERIILKAIESELQKFYGKPEQITRIARKILDLGYATVNNELRELLNQEQASEILMIGSILSRLERSSSTIAIASDRATRVVKALNNFSHSDTQTKWNWFNLKESFDSAIVLFWNQIKHGINLALDIPEDVLLFGNADAFSQVWTNIIKNAVQATNGQGTINIRYQKVNHNHVIEISNNGKAIPPENLSRIFEAFYTTKQKGEGTGLGLNIVRNIIEQHAGTIGCTSETAETKFIINIPEKK